jgi:hypothetical protein
MLGWCSAAVIPASQDQRRTSNFSQTPKRRPNIQQRAHLPQAGTPPDCMSHIQEAPSDSGVVVTRFGEVGRIGRLEILIKLAMLKTLNRLPDRDRYAGR